MSRRGLLAAMSGCACTLPGVLRAAPATGGAGGAIDVHNHFFPPSLTEASNRMLAAINNGQVPARIREWTPAKAVEAMDRNRVAKSVVSASWRPALLEMSADELRRVTREANDYAAKMAQDHPGRFSHFGFMPMPNVDATLAEIAYCMDVLKTPGIGMMTSYGTRWQGDPMFRPVLEELNRRKAVVFCHPQPAACCGNLMPDITGSEADLVEFPYDTGRAVVGLLMSGSFAKYPDIRWIFCHCGGPVPALSGRIRAKVALMDQDKVAVFAPKGVDYELRRQFYDTADASYGPPIAALTNYVPQSQILFGTDFPYVSVDDNVKELGERKLSPAMMAGIQRGNVLRLMPQLA